MPTVVITQFQCWKWLHHKYFIAKIANSPNADGNLPCTNEWTLHTKITTKGCTYFLAAPKRPTHAPAATKKKKIVTHSALRVFKVTIIYLIVYKLKAMTPAKRSQSSLITQKCSVTQINCLAEISLWYRMRTHMCPNANCRDRFYRIAKHLRIFPTIDEILYGFYAPNIALRFFKAQPIGYFNIHMIWHNFFCQHFRLLTDLFTVTMYKGANIKPYFDYKSVHVSQFALFFAVTFTPNNIR